MKLHKRILADSRAAIVSLMPRRRWWPSMSILLCAGLLTGWWAYRIYALMPWTTVLLWFPVWFGLTTLSILGFAWALVVAKNGMETAYKTLRAYDIGVSVAGLCLCQGMLFGIAEVQLRGYRQFVDPVLHPILSVSHPHLFNLLIQWFPLMVVALGTIVLVASAYHSICKRPENSEGK